MPTKVFLWEGALDRLREVSANYEHVLVLATGSLPGCYVDEVKGLLGHSLETFNYGELNGEPTKEGVEKLREKKTIQTDCVVGIGGGSYIDTAKLVAIHRRSDWWNIYEGSTFVALPIVAIPTTAGTGSETSKSAIVNVNGIKKGVRSAKLFPKIAIVDPRLGDSMPRDVTLYTAFDAFTHAVETYVSRRGTPFTRNNSRETIDVIFEELPRAMDEFSRLGRPSIRTRERLSYAAMLQGINLANASTCMPHRIQYGISTVSKASHPKGLAAVYRAWLDLAQPVIGDYTHNDIINLMDRLGISLTLSEIGVTRDDLDNIVSRVEGNLVDDPYYRDSDTIKGLLLQSL